MHFFEIAVARR